MVRSNPGKNTSLVRLLYSIESAAEDIPHPMNGEACRVVLATLPLGSALQHGPAVLDSLYDDTDELALRCTRPGPPTMPADKITRRCRLNTHGKITSHPYNASYHSHRFIYALPASGAGRGARYCPEGNLG